MLNYKLNENLNYVNILPSPLPQKSSLGGGC